MVVRGAGNGARAAVRGEVVPGFVFFVRTFERLERLRAQKPVEILRAVRRLDHRELLLQLEHLLRGLALQALEHARRRQVAQRRVRVQVQVVVHEKRIAKGVVFFCFASRRFRGGGRARRETRRETRPARGFLGGRRRQRGRRAPDERPERVPARRRRLRRVGTSRRKRRVPRRFMNVAIRRRLRRRPPPLSRRDAPRKQRAADRGEPGELVPAPRRVRHLRNRQGRAEVAAQRAHLRAEPTPRADPAAARRRAGQVRQPVHRRVDALGRKRKRVSVSLVAPMRRRPRVRRASSRDAHTRDHSLLRGRGVRGTAVGPGIPPPPPEPARQRARHAPEQRRPVRIDGGRVTRGAARGA